MALRNLEALALMASEDVQLAFIDGSTQKEYLLPDEIYDHCLDSLKRMLFSADEPNKERVLNLYVYCIRQSDSAEEACFYGTPEWSNVRTAVRAFLIHIENFDLKAWEMQELSREP